MRIEQLTGQRIKLVRTMTRKEVMTQDVVLLEITWRYDEDPNLYVCKNITIANQLLLKLCQERHMDYESDGIQVAYPEEQGDLSDFTDAIPDLLINTYKLPIVQSVKPHKRVK